MAKDFDKIIFKDGIPYVFVETFLGEAVYKKTDDLEQDETPVSGEPTRVVKVDGFD